MPVKKVIRCRVSRGVGLAECDSGCRRPTGSPYTGCGVGRRRGDEEKGQEWRQFPAAQPIGVLRDPRAFCWRHRGADYDHLVSLD